MVYLLVYVRYVMSPLAVEVNDKPMFTVHKLYIGSIYKATLIL